MWQQMKAVNSQSMAPCHWKKVTWWRSNCLNIQVLPPGSSQNTRVIKNILCWNLWIFPHLQHVVTVHYSASRCIPTPVPVTPGKKGWEPSNLLSFFSPSQLLLSEHIHSKGNVRAFPAFEFELYQKPKISSSISSEIIEKIISMSHWKIWGI